MKFKKNGQLKKNLGITLESVKFSQENYQKTGINYNKLFSERK